MRAWLAFLAILAAGPALAEDVPAPAGCTITATILRPNCEMHHVLACEDQQAVRVDVYRDGVFLGEQAYVSLALTRWRRGAMLQELTVTSGDFAAAPTLPEDEVLEVTAERSRRMLATDTPPMTTAFDYRIEVVGPAVRTLPGGGDREVRRFREMAVADNGEALDVTVDYDPALGLPIWTTGVVTGSDGETKDISTGVAAIYTDGEAGFRASSAPAGAACIPD